MNPPFYCLVALAVVSAVLGDAQYGHPYWPVGPYGHYPIYPSAPSLPDSLSHQPYIFSGARHGSNGQIHQEGRFDGALLSTLSVMKASKTTTVISTTTSISTTTCTKSTTACAGRRRRSILGDLIDHQYVEIDPSAVQPVEATAKASMPDSHSENERVIRKADPSFSFFQPGFGLQSSGGGFDSLSSPLFPTGGVGNAGGLLSFLEQLGGIQKPSGQDARFEILYSLISLKRHTTKTCTIFTVSTVTSTPSCSVAGTLAQCPTG